MQNDVINENEDLTDKYQNPLVCLKNYIKKKSFARVNSILQR